MWLWANYLAHPSLCSYSCRVGITVPPFKGVCKDEKRCYAEITELRIPCPAKLDSLWNSPWNSPGQHTGVGSCSLLQRIFPTQGLNPGLVHCIQILYHLSYQGSPSEIKTYSKKKKNESMRNKFQEIVSWNKDVCVYKHKSVYTYMCVYIFWYMYFVFASIFRYIQMFTLKMSKIKEKFLELDLW